MYLLENTFKEVQAAGRTLKPTEVLFGSTKIKYLGHVIFHRGIQIESYRVQIIIYLAQPMTAKELRSVPGMANLDQTFMPNCAALVESLVAVTSKEVAQNWSLYNHWKEEQIAVSFSTKQPITPVRILRFPDFSTQFVSHVDASDAGAICQERSEMRHTILT